MPPEDFSPTAESTPESLLQMARSFQNARILLTAYELELFTTLGEESKTSGEVAQILGTDERATDRLMNALCALGLLEKTAGRFSNAPIAWRCLMKGKPEYLSGLMHVAHLWETWSTLTEAVRRGGSVFTREEGEAGKKQTEAFIGAMDYGAIRRAQGIVALLDLSQVTRILDVGGGSGAYSIAFVRASERIRATVFDLPQVIPLTKKYIEQEGLSDRVDTIAGDYMQDHLGKGYDLVFLSQVIHSNSFDENTELMAKATSALNPGGQVVIQDFIMSEDRVSPSMGAIFALNMLVATSAGDTYTESEVRRMMARAGLSSVKRLDTEFNTALIIVKKE